MGAVPSTSRSGSARPLETAEYLIGTFVGKESFPLVSDFWQKLLQLPLDLRWSDERVNQACEFFAQNNRRTRHLAKIFIHLAWCLEECISTSDVSSSVFTKAMNALYISSVFLKYLIEKSEGDNVWELHLFLDETEPMPDRFTKGLNIEKLVIHSVLSFIGSVDVSPNTYIVHQEVLNFMLIAMSTQLLSGPSLGPKDVNPFTDAAIAQGNSLVCSVVQRLLCNYLVRPYVSAGATSSSSLSEVSHRGVLQRVSSVAANFLLLPFNYLVSSKDEGSRSLLAEWSLLVLLVLIHYRKVVQNDENITDRSHDCATSDALSKQTTYLCDNPFCKALENARDIEYRAADVKGNTSSGPLVKLPYAALFDTLGMCLTEETSVLLLYSLIQGNSAFLEYVLVRTDIDTLLMPILETLYNASSRRPNHIYMLLILLLILSQDSSFNASIHKLTLPSVPWYQERRLHQTSLGSLLVIVLIRTVKYNLSKMRDVYLHTNCLATLGNMAPHCHRLSAYASERLVSLFDMLSKKYNKLAELRDEKRCQNKVNSIEEADSLVTDMLTEFYIYTDFLRIVLEILNEILTYALPRNPEVVYAIMHRQEVFQPFKNHPRYNELLENIYTVLDFFNSRMDAHRMDGEWSVDKVLEVIIINCRSWRGEGIKMFTQLRFTYEQESQSEEFFIPYIWQLVLPRCGFIINPSAIKLFPVVSAEKEMGDGEEESDRHQDGDPYPDRKVNGIFLDP